MLPDPRFFRVMAHGVLVLQHAVRKEFLLARLELFRLFLDSLFL